jgi:hypothetical protein
MVIPGQPRQNACKALSQPIKTGYGGMHLSSQGCRKCKQENHSPDLPMHKYKIIFKKIPKNTKGLVV